LPQRSLGIEPMNTPHPVSIFIVRKDADHRR